MGALYPERMIVRFEEANALKSGGTAKKYRPEHSNSCARVFVIFLPFQPRIISINCNAANGGKELYERLQRI